MANDGQSYWKALRRTVRYHVRSGLGLPIRPLKLRLSLTNRCNSRCIMCSIWQFQDNGAPSLPGEITVEEIERLAAVNRDFLGKVDHISLTGGEPTLRRDLVEVTRALTEGFPGRTLSFNSNGFNTRRIIGMVEQILEFRKQLTVMISLDAIGEQHNVIRGMRGDVCTQVIKTIDGLAAMRGPGRRLKLQVNTVMTNENRDQLMGVWNFCRERGVQFNPIYITYGQLYQNQQAEAGTIKLTGESRERLLKDAEQIMRHEPGLQLYEAVNLLRTDRRDFDCWAGKLMMLIEENCDVFPNGGCPTDFKLGNLRDFGMDLKALLASPPARRILGGVSACRLCQIPCEYMTTLNHAEALTGWRKRRELTKYAQGTGAAAAVEDID